MNDRSNDLHQARAAFASRTWMHAYRCFSAVDHKQPLAAHDLELYATSAYLAGEDESSAELWTRAHNDFLNDGNLARAARCIFWLTLDLFNRGEWARGSGWLARGLRLFEDNPDTCPEHGLLLVLAARNYLKQGNVTLATEAAAHASQLATQFADTELTVFSRLGLALVQARAGRFAEATTLFDEIMVAVTVDEVSPICVGVVYCAVIDGCHALCDLSRAREWTYALDRWCGAQPDMVAFRGKCLVHRAEILRISGSWPQALAEAEEACRWSDPATPSFKYPVGEAYYELAEIYRLRGEFKAAAAAYHRASEHGHSPEPGLALLHLQEGVLDVAQSRIRRVLSEQQSGLSRALVLHAAVDILTATSDVQAARAAAEELTAMAERYDAAMLRARAAHATGAVHLAAGDEQRALPALREAWMLWQQIEAPYEAARVRVLLGLICQELGDDAGAALEFDAARVIFRRLSAAPDLARLENLILPRRNIGSRKLSARELQVVALIAQGKTNQAIAKQLFISVRTVDRHVSNILLKLQLPSRAAATAYAYEHGLL
jgi:DNA-binding CsgD family transcriptional regulator